MQANGKIIFRGFIDGMGVRGEGGMIERNKNREEENY